MGWPSTDRSFSRRIGLIRDRWASFIKLQLRSWRKGSVVPVQQMAGECTEHAKRKKHYSFRCSTELLHVALQRNFWKQSNEVC